ncbi:MAG TPA: hypothetical protein VGG75_05910 [Trebonia sp.]
MNGHTRHPGTGDLADFRAGVATGARGEEIAAHVAQCSACAAITTDLDALTALLGSVPIPALPEDIEGRIMAAIAAEAARTDTQGALSGQEPVLADESGSPAATTLSGPEAGIPVADADGQPAGSGLRLLARGGRPRLRRSSSRPSSSRPSSPLSSPSRRPLSAQRPGVRAPLGVLVAAVACLALAGVGYTLGTPSSAARPAVAGGRAESTSAANGSAARHDLMRPSMGPDESAGFTVIETTVDYGKATLRVQVSQQLAAQGAVPGDVSPSGTAGATSQAGPSQSAPGQGSGTGSGRASASSGGTASEVPPPSLVGCVMRVTDDARPELVERARYQARPAYVIASQTRAWVVPTTCTAADPAVLASVPLSPAAG